MAKLAISGGEDRHGRRAADAIYAGLIVVWIAAIWTAGLYFAMDAAADADGNSFLLACILATAGILTVFSGREFLVAWGRIHSGS